MYIRFGRRFFTSYVRLYTTMYKAFNNLFFFILWNCFGFWQTISRYRSRDGFEIAVHTREYTSRVRSNTHTHAHASTPIEFPIFRAVYPEDDSGLVQTENWPLHILHGPLRSRCPWTNPHRHHRTISYNPCSFSIKSYIHTHKYLVLLRLFILPFSFQLLLPLSPKSILTHTHTVSYPSYHSHVKKIHSYIHGNFSSMVHVLTGCLCTTIYYWKIAFEKKRSQRTFKITVATS